MMSCDPSECKHVMECIAGWLVSVTRPKEVNTIVLVLHTMWGCIAAVQLYRDKRLKPWHVWFRLVIFLLSHFCGCL